MLRDERKNAGCECREVKPNGGQPEEREIDLDQQRRISEQLYIARCRPIGRAAAKARDPQDDAPQKSKNGGQHEDLDRRQHGRPEIRQVPQDVVEIEAYVLVHERVPPLSSLKRSLNSIISSKRHRKSLSLPDSG